MHQVQRRCVRCIPRAGGRPVIINTSYLRFEAGESGLNVFSEIDVGYMEHLDCGGYMSLTYTITPDSDGVAEQLYRNLKDGSNTMKIVYVRGSLYYVVDGQGIFHAEMQDGIIRATASGQFSYPILKGHVNVPRS